MADSDTLNVPKGKFTQTRTFSSPNLQLTPEDQITKEDRASPRSMSTTAIQSSSTKQRQSTSRDEHDPGPQSASLSTPNPNSETDSAGPSDQAASSSSKPRSKRGQRKPKTQPTIKDLSQIGNFEDMTPEQVKKLKANDKPDYKVDIHTFTRTSKAGDVYSLVAYHVPAAMLVAFSGLARRELANVSWAGLDKQHLFLSSFPHCAVKVFVGWMYRVCDEGLPGHIDTRMTPYEWISLWNLLDELQAPHATQQMKNQLQKDLASRNFQETMDIWHFASVQGRELVKDTSAKRLWAFGAEKLQQVLGIPELNIMARDARHEKFTQKAIGHWASKNFSTAAAARMMHEDEEKLRGASMQLKEYIVGKWEQWRAQADRVTRAEYEIDHQTTHIPSGGPRGPSGDVWMWDAEKGKAVRVAPFVGFSR